MVVDHRPQWPLEFEQLAGQSRAAMGGVAWDIDHVGSTAVPVWRPRTASTSRSGCGRSTRGGTSPRSRRSASGVGANPGTVRKSPAGSRVASSSSRLRSAPGPATSVCGRAQASTPATRSCSATTRAPTSRPAGVGSVQTAAGGERVRPVRVRPDQGARHRSPDGWGRTVGRGDRLDRHTPESTGVRVTTEGGRCTNSRSQAPISRLPAPRVPTP